MKKKSPALIVFCLQAHVLCLEFLGEVLAKQFASLGAKLILSARNEAELVRVKSELKGTNFMQKVSIF